MSKPRPLPANPEAERTLLGGLLVDGRPDALGPLLTVVAATDFASRATRATWEALTALADSGQRLDTVTLADELQRQKALDDVGGPAFLAGLVDGLPRVTNLESWARLIRRASLKRQLAHASRGFCEDALDDAQEPEDVADAALQKLLELAGKAAPIGFLDNAQLARAALREIEIQAQSPDGMLGLRTGLLDLDRRLQGLRDGTMGIIAARAKKGKSVLAMQFAEHNALEAEGHVAVFSLEMSGVALTKRRLSSLARVNVNRLHEADDLQLLEDGRTQKQQRWLRLNEAAIEVTKRRLSIMTSAYTVPQIHAACRRLKAEKGLSLVVVDYAQLLDATRKHEKRYLEVREISRSLVRLALELSVPVVVAAQLNREAEGRKDSRPSSADIADGDSLIRDASWCLLIHRDLQPKKGQDPNELRNLAHLILSDNRHGWNGTIRTRWNPALARFEDLAREEQEAARAPEERGAA